MKVHLRFGMHRDVQLIHKEKGQIDGLVIPAHILAHQSASTSVFVTSMHERPYVIDPMTFVFQNDKAAHLNDALEIRPSIRKLCEAYGDFLADYIMALETDEALPPSAFTASNEFCQNVANFQLSEVAKASATSGASKYLNRYGKTQVTAPRAVIPPYFRFGSVGDDWYEVSLDSANKTLTLVDSVEVAPVICCAAAILDDEAAKRIAKDYSRFKRVFIWIDRYVQTSVAVSDVQKVRNLLGSLRDKGVELEALYGGYLLILSAFDGISAISHGILYTQHKSTARVPGSGGVPERYYIPAIHEFRSLSQTDLILHKHPELMCDCEVCTEFMAGNPDNIIKFSDNPNLLRSHFLRCRRREADSISTSSAETEAKRLRETFQQYHESFSALPNPDSFVSTSKMQGLDYLDRWAEAIEH